MTRKAHNEEQIVATLREGEGGAKVSEICRQMGIRQATYLVCKK